MYSFFYSAFFFLCAPLILVVFVARYGLRRTLRGLPERFGFGGPQPIAGVLWVHAASVGEVRAAEPFLRALPERFPGLPRLLTTTTVNAKEMAERLGLAERVRLAPIDRPGAVRRVIKAYKPKAVVLIETELWPHWLETLAAEKVPVMVANGRISDGAFGLYYRLRGMWEGLLATLARAAVQSPVNASRFLQLGAHPEAVMISGNLKYDVPLADLSRRTALRVSYSVAGGPVLVAGSTHRGEEEKVVAAFQRLRHVFPAAKLVLAPRHVERAAEVARLAADLGRVSLRSRLSDGRSWDVLVLDTVGELADLYGIGDAAFVGGSFAAKGGQNPLEPARWGVPVFFGPHMENFREVAKLFLERHAAVAVADGEALFQEVHAVWNDKARAQVLGQAAREAADSQRGALDATLTLVADTLARGARQGRAGCGAC